MTRHRQHYTSEEVETLKRMIDEGHSHEEIAARLGRTVWAIRRKAAKLGALKHRKYTSEEDEQIKELSAQGYTDAEIAAKIGRSKHSVQRRREDYLDVCKKRPWTVKEIRIAEKRWLEGVPVTEIAKEINRSPVAVRAKLRENGMVKELAWPPEDEQRLRNLWERNLSVAEIAKRLGRTEDAVWKKAKKMGLPRRRKLRKRIRQAERRVEQLHKLLGL